MLPDGFVSKPLTRIARDDGKGILIIINPEQIPGMPQMLPGERIFDLPGIGLCRHKAGDDEGAAGDEEAGDDDEAAGEPRTGDGSRKRPRAQMAVESPE